MKVDNIIYVTDKFNVSTRTYRELTHQCAALPKEHVLQKRKSELNSGCTINEIGNRQGVWQSFKECLVNRLSNSDQSNQDILSKNTIQIKISGDGTKFGKRIHIVNITFCIIGESCSGADGQYLLAILKVPEKYESMKSALSELISEICETKSVVVADTEYTPELFLGGDLKFLNQVMGIDSFGSKYSCLWCKCPSELRWDTSKKWSMTNSEEGARTKEKSHR